MLSFKSFLIETPWINTDISPAKYDPVSDSTEWKMKYSGARKVSTLPWTGHVVKKVLRNDLIYDDEIPAGFTIHDPVTKKMTLRVLGHFKKNTNKFFVGSLESTKNNTAKAVDVYHHLVTHHNVHLHSDYEQSPGAEKVWKALHRKPGIHMQSFNGSSKKYFELKPSFQKNYDYDSSTRLAAKKETNT